MDLTQIQKTLAEINERLQNLESRMSALDGAGADVHSADPKKRSGPRSKINDADLFERRDAFVLGIETVWREFEPGLLMAATAEDVRKVLEEVAPSMPIQDWMKGQIVETSTELFEFLISGRMRKTVSKATIATLRRKEWDERSWRAADAFGFHVMAHSSGKPEFAFHFHTSSRRLTGKLQA